MHRAPLELPFHTTYDAWMHVRIVVSGKSAEVYIRDMETPALFIPELKRDMAPGGVGLTAGNFAPAHFSNFSFSTGERPALKGTPPPRPLAAVGTVRKWSVSTVFDGASLDGKVELSEAEKLNPRWRDLESEPTGITNLARLTGVGKGKDTVFARIVVESDREQLRKMRFGYSDKVRVFCNDRILYGGSNAFQSRDYRYLGTIGLFDEVYLPLRKGRNEVWIAVTENFGGWGVLAAFDDLEGLAIK